jgi:hypothetical protein
MAFPLFLQKYEESLTNKRIKRGHEESPRLPGTAPALRSRKSAGNLSRLYRSYDGSSAFFQKSSGVRAFKVLTPGIAFQAEWCYDGTLKSVLKQFCESKGWYKLC